MSVRGGWDPPRHQCHSDHSQGNATLTSAPTEFRQVTGCPVAEAIDCHPVSDYSTLSSSENPHRLELGLYLSFGGRSPRGRQSKTKLTATAGKTSENGLSAAPMRRSFSVCEDTNMSVSLNIQYSMWNKTVSRHPLLYAWESLPEKSSTASSQASSKDSFPQTASWLDFTRRDLRRTQTVRRFSDRSAKPLQASSIVFMSICNGWKKSPEGHQWKKDQACTSEIFLIRPPAVNYLDSSSERPIIPDHCVLPVSQDAPSIFWGPYSIFKRVSPRGQLIKQISLKYAGQQMC